MTWQPIDFQSLISFDIPIVSLFKQYLDEKESESAIALMQLLQRFLEDDEPQTIAKRAWKLSEVISVMEKKLQKTERHIELTSKQQWVDRINQKLWDYAEIMEGNITELFQQLDQTTLELWHDRLAEVVGSIKEILLGKIDDLVQIAKKLEKILRRFFLDSVPKQGIFNFFRRLSLFWIPILDKSLLVQLEKDRDTLKQQYDKFNTRYEGYLSISEQVEKTFDSFSDYPMFSSLDSETQSHFIKLYRLLKLWELNCHVKVLPSRDFVLALCSEISMDKAISIFRDYYNVLKKNLFEKSLFIKENGSEFLAESLVKSLFLETLSKQPQQEIKLLGTTIIHYRDFLLREDPDPYVRSQLGFSEWVAGPEPMQLKPLVNLRYDLESLNELYERLELSVKKAHHQRQTINQLDPLIQHVLHEMGQPFASHRVMRFHAEHLLGLMQQLDELGSTDLRVISYTGRVFAKALRVDWRYHVLHGISLFHQLYSIHQGMLKPIQDRQHNSRVHKFHQLLDKILEFVKTQKTQTRFHDVELDINDIRGYLQDFLGYVQRMSTDSSLTQEQRESFRSNTFQQLLEYRYLFGNFFYQLRQHEEGRYLIRKQFLFVDQYLDSLEYQLHKIPLTDQESTQIEPEDDR